MKHYSANLEQSVTVDNGDITITAEDSLIIDATSDELTASDATRALQITNGTASQYIIGTGQLVANDLVAATGTGIAYNTTTNIITFTGVDGTAMTTVDLSGLGGANTNPTAGSIPIAVTSADAYTGAGEEFADSSLTQTAASGLVTASNGLTATAGNITTGSGNLVSGANLTVAGTTTLGDGTGTDTVTVSSLATGTQRAVLASAGGVLSAVSTIPDTLLPNISIGDVFTYTSTETTKAAAENAFYDITPTTAAGGISPGQPYHKGDIAIITYNTNQTAVLIYVGDNQTTVGPTPGNNDAEQAAQWHDISISATGIMDINVDGVTIQSTGGTSPTLSAITGAPVDAGTGLSTQNEIFDFVTGRQIRLDGDVTSVATNISGTGETVITSALGANTVNITELNTGTDMAQAGEVLTVASDGSTLEWTVNGTGTVNKLTGSFTGAASTAIDMSALGDGGQFATIQVYEVTASTSGAITTSTISQIIPDSIVITSALNTTPNPATTTNEVVITVGVAATAGTEYRYVITA